MNGILFVTATPIGNMSDVTERAVETLKISDIVIAEDTRETKKLFDRFNIKTKLESYHKFSEKKELEKYIKLLEDGFKIALVSDAGTPAVSDPGKYLVKEALAKKIRVVPIPGPSAAISAFSVSGCESNSFIFAGFLPQKGAVRIKELEKFLSFGLPVIFYESPARIKNLLNLLEKSASRIVVCRELTKYYEEIFLYESGDICEKGEFTLVAEPLLKNGENEEEPDPELIELIKKYNISAKDALTLLGKTNPNIKSNQLRKIIYKE